MLRLEHSVVELLDQGAHAIHEYESVHSLDDHGQLLLSFQIMLDPRCRRPKLTGYP